MKPAGKAPPDLQRRAAAAEPLALPSTAGGLSDMRPSAMAQHKLMASIAHSPRIAAQRRQLDGLGVLQRVVSASATYVPQQAAMTHINNLDGQVATAEQAAANEINNPTGGIHTAFQANYLRNPLPMTWGYCVEEQLNPLATARGWATQYVMPNARPDYCMDSDEEGL